MKMSINPKVLPTVLMVVDVLAALGYAIDGGFSEWRRVVYWLAAATLTFVVTY